MTMLIGDRTVRGNIKRREEARAIYERAQDTGHVASLLDQERPNIFTQSVANIMPGAQGQDHHQLRRDAEVRRRLLRVRLPDGRRPALHSRASHRTGRAVAGRPTPTAVPDASRITPASRRRARAPATTSRCE